MTDFTSFYSFLDNVCSGQSATRRAAKEELDSNSSQEDFIAAISQAVADFIRSNRNAFDLDDSNAIAEFTDVLSVEEVKQRILTNLSEPIEEEPIQEEPQSEESSDELELPTEDTEQNSDELVSDDVMKLLDE